MNYSLFRKVIDLPHIGRQSRVFGVRLLVTALVRGGSTPLSSDSIQDRNKKEGCDRSQKTKALTSQRTP